MKPAAVHTGLAPALPQQRQSGLARAYAAHPKRFVCGLPQPADGQIANDLPVGGLAPTHCDALETARGYAVFG